MSGLALAKTSRADEGVRTLERAVAIVPASVEMATMLGIVLVHAGRHDEALEAFQASSQLGLFQLDWAHEFTGNAHFFQHRFSDAIAAYERIVDPPSWIYAYLAACCAHDGDDEAAGRQVAAYQRSLIPEHGEQADLAHYMNEQVLDMNLYKRPEDTQLMIEGFRKAGLLE